jgi:hypothetical protein
MIRRIMLQMDYKLTYSMYILAILYTSTVFHQHQIEHYTPYTIPNSVQFSYPPPNMILPLESSVRTGAGTAWEFDTIHAKKIAHSADPF